MEPEVNKNDDVDKLKRQNGDEIEMRISVSGLALADRQQTDSRQQSLMEDSDVIGLDQPVNLTAPAADCKKSGRDGARSQYHSIQQLSRPANTTNQHGGLNETLEYVGSRWHGRYLSVDETDDDTLHVLRSLLRRYDKCVEPRLNVDLASSRVSSSDIHGSSLSSDELEGLEVLPRPYSPPSSSTHQAKRARVEHIVNNIRVPTYDDNTHGGRVDHQRAADDEGPRRSKRKQTQPQQHDSATVDTDSQQLINGDLSDDDEDEDDGRIVYDDHELRQQLHDIQLRLQSMYHKYTSSSDVTHLESAEFKMESDSERLTGLLKAELRHVVDGMVDRLIQRFLNKQPTHVTNDSKPPVEFTPLSVPVFSPPPPPPPLFPPLLFPVCGADMLTLRRAYVDSLVQRATTNTDQDGGSYNSTSGATVVTSLSTESSQMSRDKQLIQDAFAPSLIVNAAGLQKKKRTKVTDTRLSPRVARALLQDGFYQRNRHSLDGVHRKHSTAELSMRSGTSLYGHQLDQHQQPASLLHRHLHHQYQRQADDPIPQFNATATVDHHQLSTSLHRHRQPGTSFTPSRRLPELSERACVDRYDYMLFGCTDQFAKTSTLTPMHLRKAKLMFFYVRYPSSAILKVYFPDVKFNKNNTAQLVKWFSNFREFFYIQMEKYARQALSEGLKNVSSQRG